MKPKFKPGDKVRIVRFTHGSRRHTELGFCVDDIITIKHHWSFNDGYTVVECNDDWYFYEDELALASSQNTMEISVTIPLNDKKQAHRLVHTLVEKAYEDHEKSEERKRWTPVEIDIAKSKIADWVKEVILCGGDVSWSNVGNTIICKYNISPFITYGEAKPSGDDEYNEWIGKCVSLAKAMGKPVPSFITNKNKGVK